jgi:hypothetical protein
MANWMKRPIFFTSFFSMYWVGSKFLTSPAIWQLNALASNAVMEKLRSFPFRIACQVLRPDAHGTQQPDTRDDDSSCQIDLRVKTGAAYYLPFLPSM